MNVLFIEWNSFGNSDIKEAFEQLGHEVFSFPFDGNGELKHDEKIEESIIKKCEQYRADMVFSLNYYPIVALACHKAGMAYYSWIYDSPYVLLYSYTVIFETNHIFVFDKSQYLEFVNNGISTVQYLPMGVNIARLNSMMKNVNAYNKFKASSLGNRTPVAFVGSLYNESHQFYDRMTSISDWTRGYLEGVMNAQKNVYGYNFVRDMMTEEIMDDMAKDIPMTVENDSVVSRDYLFGEYVVNRKLTSLERQEYISSIAETFGKHGEYALDLYTGNREYSVPHVYNHGRADYYDEAPYIFNSAKINLNITLRSIHSGMPLRAFDIMGAGGFLLTNYQGDFEEYFVEGEDYASFSSKEEMLEKIDFYQNHDDIRREMINNCYKKIVDKHTYIHRLAEMLSI